MENLLRTGGEMEGLVRARGVLEGRRRDGGSHKSRWKMEGLTIRLFTQLDGPKFIEYISLDIQFHFCPVKINEKLFVRDSFW